MAITPCDLILTSHTNPSITAQGADATPPASEPPSYCMQAMARAQTSVSMRRQAKAGWNQETKAGDGRRAGLHDAKHSRPDRGRSRQFQGSHTAALSCFVGKRQKQATTTNAKYRPPHSSPYQHSSHTFLHLSTLRSRHTRPGATSTLDKTPPSNGTPAPSPQPHVTPN